MSVGYIYGNRSTSDYKDEGMIMRDALEAVRKYGDVEYSLFPYNEEVPYVIEVFERQRRSLFNEGYPNRISHYCRVTDVNAIKSALKSTVRNNKYYYYQYDESNACLRHSS